MTSPGQRDEFAPQRARMVSQQLRPRQITDQGILGAFERVPRHEFVPLEYRKEAYEDRPLAIGHDQTISQPYIVALMLQLAGAAPGKRVLDVGGGSGYQAALLAEIGCEVTSIEIVPELAARMKDRLARLGYTAVECLTGDAQQIAVSMEPFAAVIAAAAPDTVPQPLIDCLSPGGRLVLPVGEQFQELIVVEKQPDGTVCRENHGFVAFVPMRCN